jgi:NAD(P)-dependent dehydrogenase (short-subunit alcohol dehydrogenase family)
MQLTDKTVLVTGSNRGIGAALVRALLDAGVKRVYAAARTPQPSGDDRVVPVALDVTNDTSVSDLAARLPDVEILINNAGVSRGQKLLDGPTLEAAEDEIRVNYLGPLAMIRAFAPILRKNSGGAIVNILSILSRVTGGGSYPASKAAAYSLTQGVRAELAHQSTLVIGVMPGFVDTEMTKNITAPKITPESVAQSVIDALQNGTEDVYPGPAADIAAALQRDPKAVERQFAAQFARRTAVE